MSFSKGQTRISVISDGCIFSPYASTPKRPENSQVRQTTSQLSPLNIIINFFIFFNTCAYLFLKPSSIESDKLVHIKASLSVLQCHETHWVQSRGNVKTFFKMVIILCAVNINKLPMNIIHVPLNRVF